MLLNICYKINNINYLLTLLHKNSITILESCLNRGIYIPHFCYNKYLSISGNCRICIIEIEKVLKPVISCLNICVEKLSIYTNSFSIKKLRENVLEFLLINHPLDCPVCDQGGECDLQEQTIFFGLDISRFYLKKKTNINIFLNKNIKFILNRCILCVRCVRYLRESNIDNTYNLLGTIGRGYYSMVHTYKKSKINLLGSSNIVDLCPVGALTIKLNQFAGRPWESITYNFIDIFDSFGLPVIIDKLKSEYIKIFPSLDYVFNLEFISDFTRNNMVNILSKSNKNLKIKNIDFLKKNLSLVYKLNNNCFFSYEYFFNIFSNYSFKYFKYENIEYLDYNNYYILNNNLLNSLNKYIKLNSSKIFNKYMFRFSLFLNKLNKKYNNIILNITSDFKINEIYNNINSKKEINFVNNILNKNDFKYNLNIYVIKFLNFFKILLILDLYFLYIIKNIIYNSYNNDFHYVNLTNILNIFRENNIYMFSDNYIGDIYNNNLSLYNIVGNNIFDITIYLICFSILVIFCFQNSRIKKECV